MDTGDKKGGNLLVATVPYCFSVVARADVQKHRPFSLSF